MPRRVFTILNIENREHKFHCQEYCIHHIHETKKMIYLLQKQNALSYCFWDLSDKGSYCYASKTRTLFSRISYSVEKSSFLAMHMYSDCFHVSGSPAVVSEHNGMIPPICATLRNNSSRIITCTMNQMAAFLLEV